MTARTYVVVVQYRLKDDPPRMPKRLWETRVQASNPVEAGWKASAVSNDAEFTEEEVVSIRALVVG